MLKTALLQNWWLILFGIAIFVIVKVLLTIAQKKGPREKPTARLPLTPHEQKMFFRLKQAAPTLNILAQVSFGALLTAKTLGGRNRFDRKIADFVLCDAAFSVVVIVELDDASHDGREARDDSRDKMLRDAGYRVIRWRGIPNLEDAQRQIAALIARPALTPSAMKKAT